MQKSCVRLRVVVPTLIKFWPVRWRSPGCNDADNRTNLFGLRESVRSRHLIRTCFDLWFVWRAALRWLRSVLVIVWHILKRATLSSCTMSARYALCSPPPRCVAKSQEHFSVYHTKISFCPVAVPEPAVAGLQHEYVGKSCTKQLSQHNQECLVSWIVPCSQIHEFEAQANSCTETYAIWTQMHPLCASVPSPRVCDWCAAIAMIPWSKLLRFCDPDHRAMDCRVGRHVTSSLGLTLLFLQLRSDKKVFDSSVSRGAPFTFTIGVGEVRACLHSRSLCFHQRTHYLGAWLVMRARFQLCEKYDLLDVKLVLWYHFRKQRSLKDMR